MNPSNFLLTTDNPFDKMLPAVEGSFSAGARYALFSPRRTTSTVVNTTGDERLPEGFWSINNSTWYPMGMSPPDISGGSPSFQTTEVDCYCNEEGIVIACSNYTASSVTIYYYVRLTAED